MDKIFAFYSSKNMSYYIRISSMFKPGRMEFIIFLTFGSLKNSDYFLD